MSHFTYRNGQLCAEQVPLSEIATQFGTPCYVYSKAAFEQQWQRLDTAFGTHQHTICYAVKANSNLAVLNLLAKLGSGFDIVSEGELRRVLLAGGDPSKVVFSGVAKSRREIEFALNNKIRSINIESVAELERVQEIAQAMNLVAPIALRVNPDVDPQTHPYISTGMEKAKFGITMDAAYKAYQLANDMSNIEVHGIACHIGSQITTSSPFTDAVDKVLELVARLTQSGILLKQLDLGGGLGIDYQGETPPTAQDWISTLLDSLARHDIQLPVSIEPGRYIAGNSGVLLTRVEYLKSNSTKNFAIVDAGMNDLLRPSLYQAYHQIDNVSQASAEPSQTYDVVGPICESADVLGYDRELSVAANDLLAVRSAGAYGFVMASNYNSKPRPAEIIVDGEQIHVARKRESFDDLTKGEVMLP
ncbi:UNVERIFIED_CONTAM: hypothetical protein GTU68_043192 [Idotea baltica]|nr:hypothetical protein [Idotea baltica]